MPPEVRDLREEIRRIYLAKRVPGTICYRPIPYGCPDIPFTVEERLTRDRYLAECLMDEEFDDYAVRDPGAKYCIVRPLHFWMQFYRPTPRCMPILNCCFCDHPWRGIPTTLRVPINTVRRPLEEIRDIVSAVTEEPLPAAVTDSLPWVQPRVMSIATDHAPDWPAEVPFRIPCPVRIIAQYGPTGYDQDCLVLYLVSSRDTYVKEVGDSHLVTRFVKFQVPSLCEFAVDLDAFELHAGENVRAIVGHFSCHLLTVKLIGSTCEAVRLISLCEAGKCEIEALRPYRLRVDEDC
jgi:hypothetical protein